jgi:hypothetical protein
LRVALLSLFLLVSCRTPTAWDPVGGFELSGELGPWRESDPENLRAQFDRARAALNSISDYAAALETRERIEDELYPRRVLLVKVRQQPFSVAIETIEPANEKGQRVWFDEHWNDGDLMAETPGFLGGLIGRVSLDPTGDLAMENRRHPITDTGLARLSEQIEEVFAPRLGLRHALRVRTCDAPLADRPARFVEALVPSEAPDLPLLYRFAFDAERDWLVYYGVAELSADGPALLEEYLYRDIRPNLGLRDVDFRP